jgi:antiviral helicase SLH1
MQLTKNEIAETQIIVTTPEKWDVVTRKPTGEGELASVCSLAAVRCQKNSRMKLEAQAAHYR